MLPGMNQPSNQSVSTNSDAKIYDELDRFELWFAMAWKWLVRASIAIIVVVLVIASVIAYSNHSNRVLAEELYTTMTDKNLSKADRIQALTKLIEVYDDVESAVYPRFVVAKALVDSARYADAEKIYVSIENSQSASEFAKGRALLNRANVLEMQGNTGAAIELYKTFEKINIDADPILAAIFQIEATYACARLQIAEGKQAEAKATIEALMRTVETVRDAEYYSTPYAQLIERMREELKMTSSTPSIGADFSKLPINAQELMNEIQVQ